MSLPFRRETMVARFCSPDDTTEVERRLEVRFDPLLGASSRVAEGVRLAVAQPGALEPLHAADPTCPFCPPRLEQVTPRISRQISDEGRIREGETTLFPNLVPYGQYAAVAVFSPRHWLDLADFRPRLLAGNLTAALRYIQAVWRADPDARYAAYNINYLYPSGGSLPHPHAQVYVDPYPTTVMRLQIEAGEHYLSDHGQSFWDDLVAEEERRGERFVGWIGRTAWLTPFAPLGFNEVRAVVAGCETAVDLSPEDVEALAIGISRVLDWYRASGYNSYNLALYLGPSNEAPGFQINLTALTRSALAPFYRSDAMYLERLHWEAAVDRMPEAIAAELRTSFAG